MMTLTFDLEPDYHLNLETVIDKRTINHEIYQEREDSTSFCFDRKDMKTLKELQPPQKVLQRPLYFRTQKLQVKIPRSLLLVFSKHVFLRSNSRSCLRFYLSLDTKMVIDTEKSKDGKQTKGGNSQKTFFALSYQWKQFIEV